MNKKAQVFVLIGQSNAVGHGVPMKDKDKIINPMKNVFGLSREFNQSFEINELKWTGYTSFGMNLAEEQDDTYSVANCLAKMWQDAIDKGNNLPDLYIIQIAVGAEGVTEKYIESKKITKKQMWNPDREMNLVPGKLGKVDIALTPFTTHVLSLVKDSFDKMDKDYEIMGIHWRGGENDTGVSEEVLKSSLKKIYDRIFSGFYDALGQKVPTVLHKLVAHDRCLDCDPSGKSLKGLHFVNSVFETMANENDNISIFDVTNAPQYIPDVKGNGLFIEDHVHFTPEVNSWVAEEILKNYMSEN